MFSVRAKNGIFTYPKAPHCKSSEIVYNNYNKAAARKDVLENLCNEPMTIVVHLDRIRKLRETNKRIKKVWEKYAN